MSRRIYSLVLVLIILSGSGRVCAQSNYPSRSVALLFGFAAGNDVAVRMIAEKLAEGLGTPVIVENVTGAAGNIAADRTAKAAPDGYTIGMLTGANIVIRPLLYRSAPRQPLNELVPVSLAFSFPLILVLDNQLGATTLSELVARARAAAGDLTFGHLGIGSVTHLSGELLKINAKIDLRGVPYRGAPAVLMDMMASRLAMAFVPPSMALPLLREEKIRAVAITSRTRSAFAPDLPTVAELGYPNFEMTVWFGLFVPMRTPQPIVDRLSQEVARVMQLPDIQKRFLDLGLLPIGSTQSEFNRTIAAETLVWSKFVEDAGIKPLD